MDSEEIREIYWYLDGDPNVTLTTSDLSSAPPLPSTSANPVFFSHIGFTEGVLISVIIVLVIAIVISLSYFCLVYKLGFFSDNPSYLRRTYYSSAVAASSQQNDACKSFKSRRPRPSTLCLRTTTTGGGNIQMGNISQNTNRQLGKNSLEQKANHLALEGLRLQDQPVPRRPPSVHLQQKRIGKIQKLLTSSSGPSTTTISDHSFVTACSVYITPSHGDWKIDVPLFRCSRDWSKRKAGFTAPYPFAFAGRHSDNEADNLIIRVSKTAASSYRWPQNMDQICTSRLGTSSTFLSTLACFQND